MESLATRVITADEGLAGFSKAARSFHREFAHARHLAWRLFLRDLRADHRQSALGYFWLVVPALANTVIWVFLNDQKVVHINAGAVPYPLFVFTGTILWTAFNASIMAMMGILSSARSFIGKVNFPHEALVYSALLKVCVDSIVAAAILIPAMIFFHAPFRLEVLLFPVALIANVLLGASLGLFFLPVAALYSDIGRAVQLILRFGFFLAPVIFPLPLGTIARRLMMLNPSTPIIVTGRSWLTASGEGMPLAFAAVTVGAIVLLLLALMIYKIAVPHLVERLSS